MNEELTSRRTDVTAEPDQSLHESRLESMDSTMVYPRPVEGTGEIDLPERYELIRIIGQGSFGQVLEAYDTVLNRRVAIKFQRADRALPWEEFRKEASRLAQLNHPAIVTIFDFGTHQRHPYLVTEYLPMGTLLDRMRGRESSLALSDVVSVIATLADGLEHAHQRGITHRDIKPANILFDEHGTAKLADFGLAATADEQAHETSRVLGTITYMSPEQAGGRSNWAGPQSDIFSLGVVLYQLMTNRLPFAAANETEYKHQILFRDAIPPRNFNPAIPVALEDICLKCLAKKPNERYATCRDLALDLRTSMSPPRTHDRSRWLPPTALSMITLTSVAIFIAANSLFVDRHSRNEPRRQAAEEQEPTEKRIVEPNATTVKAVVSSKQVATPLQVAGAGNEFDIKEQSNSLEMESNELQLVELKKSIEPNSVIELRAKPYSDEGSFGIYWAHDQVAENNPRVLMLQVVYFRDLVKGRMVYEGERESSGVTVKLAESPSYDLKLVVEDHKVTRLLINGIAIKPLSETSGEDLSNLVNTFGVFTNGPRVVFSDIAINRERLFLRNSPPN